jgi:hypothetical protein
MRPALRGVTGEEVDRRLVSLTTPLRLILMGLVIRLLTTVSPSIVIRQFWTRVAATVVIVGVAWLAVRFSDIVGALGEHQLLRRGRQAKIAMWVLLRRRSRPRWSRRHSRSSGEPARISAPLLTGLGIGGLGLAFAAQKTRIIDLIAEAGTGVAFPSQTTCLARDEALDPGADRKGAVAGEGLA